MKTKLESNGDEVIHFPNHTCLTVISLASALKKDESYYLQVFLKECKHIEKKVIRHIVDNLSGFCSSSEEFAEE